VTLAGADARDFEDPASREPTGSDKALCGAITGFDGASTGRIDGSGETIVGRNGRLRAFQGEWTSKTL
jgi:hypothetical protein